LEAHARGETAGKLSQAIEGSAMVVSRTREGFLGAGAAVKPSSLASPAKSLVVPQGRNIVLDSEKNPDGFGRTGRFNLGSSTSAAACCSLAVKAPHHTGPRAPCGWLASARLVHHTNYKPPYLWQPLDTFPCCVVACSASGWTPYVLAPKQHLRWNIHITTTRILSLINTLRAAALGLCFPLWQTCLFSYILYVACLLHGVEIRR
jgi:hypothetical protein